jgi:predicted nucleotidyltransferase
MRPSDALRLHRAEIRGVVEKYGARNPRVFGSVIHNQDTDSSDLDLLVDPIDGRTTLKSLVYIKRDIERLTGVTTDVLTPMALNDRIRQEILGEAVPL